MAMKRTNTTAQASVLAVLSTGPTRTRVRKAQNQVQGEAPPPTTPHPLRGVGCGGGVLSLPGQQLGTVDKILESCSKLDAAERQQLLEALSLQQLTEEHTSPERGLWAGAVHEAMKRSLGDAPSVPMLRKQLSTRAAWAPVQHVIDAAGGARLQRVQVLALLDLLAGLLVRHVATVAARSGAPATSRLLVNCVPALPAVLDQEFPGYMAAGLLHIVVRQLLAKKA